MDKTQKNIELDTKILNKNLEITRLTKQIDDLTSDNVDLQEKYQNKIIDERKVLNQVGDLTKNDENLFHLLHEVHETMCNMMTWCERLQPVKLDVDGHPDKTEGHYPIIVDLTDEEEMMMTKLFRLDDEMINEDQTSRSILKDLRKVIKSLEK